MRVSVTNLVLESAIALVGNTPLIHLASWSPKGGARVLAKAEFLNPAGSVKDRIALAMIEDAEASGKLATGVTVVEATSGNTGIALAMVCAKRGYRLILTMPDTMSFERHSLVERYGAEVVLTRGKDDMAGALDKAAEIVAKNPNCIQLKQFENPANPAVHARTTGPEILAAAGENIGAFVAGVGTGGTITGVARVLKRERPSAKIIAVEPARSPVLSGGRRGVHAIEGIGAGFVPPVLDRSLLDDIRTVEDEDAFAASQRLAAHEGLMVGISAGACVHVAHAIAQTLPPEMCVVTVLCDSGARYFSVEEFFRVRKQAPGSILL